MSKNRREYMKTYRRNYGNLMREQVTEWFKNHPYYRAGYCKMWRQFHPDYHKDWQKKHLDRYFECQKCWRELQRDKKNVYMRKYMQKYRKRISHNL